MPRRSGSLREHRPTARPAIPNLQRTHFSANLETFFVAVELAYEKTNVKAGSDKPTESTIFCREWISQLSFVQGQHVVICPSFKDTSGYAKGRKLLGSSL